MLKPLKSLAQIVPFLPSTIYHSLRRASTAYRDQHQSTEDIFTDIFRRNAWGGADSLSGTGSGLDQTQTILAEMPILFQDWGISSILDIPCGDFYWMSKLQLEGIRYIGADIVKQIIEINQKKQTDNITFIQADLLTDNLPQVDLIFCRDCLVHFSFADIHRALKNICKSNSKFLLTTTFPERDHNYDIVTGEWRVLNLEIEPFGLPAPARMLVEGCTEENGIFKDKSLGLWRISDIQQCLKTS